MGVDFLLQGCQFAVGKNQQTVCAGQFLLGNLQLYVLMQFQGGFPCLDDIGVGATEGVDEHPGFVEPAFLTECGSLLGQ